MNRVDVLIAALVYLSCTRVLLLGNNPAKSAGLSQAGIEVVGNVPLSTRVTSENRRYLNAQALRAARSSRRCSETQRI